ncbi:flagellar biosynthesis protein FlaG [Stutzerimonas stutzeri]|uniref:Flagellar biosynthesis protein FlaG n=1 Tax=Stutzerimonas stutzeri TaxID=316 RepID=A0A2N8T525_STUST|nr:flagellar protein FlaG [Stutzerimonas stutzeri]MCQ4326879.1 flagellar protein FlaG [Stutzerimonas stutzeri]PNG09816.1 flagellar biosynthesis protein FlaG [Stutzerimonas stutzeri]
MDIALSAQLPAVATAVQAQGQQLTGSRGVADRQGDAQVAGKAVSSEQQVVTVESLGEAVSSIKDFVQSIRRDLNFDLDDSTGKMVVRVTDRATGEVVRQIPTEEALRLAENLEEARSLLFKAQA